MTVGHTAQKENFQFRDWIWVWLEASPLNPRGMFHGWHRYGSDSSNLSKCSELLPVQVPVRALSLEESTNQMKLTLFTQT